MRRNWTTEGKTALLIIDTQVNMFDEDLRLYRAQEVLNIIVELLSRARSTKTPVFYLQNEGRPRDPDQRGTDGWKIHSAITPKESDIVIPKSGPDGFHETFLKHELNELGVKKLVVVGMQSELCIDATCRGAHA